MAGATQQRIRDEALAWFVRLNGGNVSDADRAALQRWLANSPRHREEYTRLADIWTDLDRIPQARLQAAAPMPRRMSRRVFLTAGGAAAALALSCADWTRLLFSDHATGTGELRDVTLADGSRLQLDADTAIELAFTEHTRNVRLLRGRVFFDVAPNADRAFVVAAGEGYTRALATRFVVHEQAGTVTVAVQESAVSVSVPDSEARMVRAGESVSYSSRHLSEVRAAYDESETAWRRGKLIFEDRPLRQVLADLNRYRPGTILVTDDRLFDMRVSGIFDIHHPDGVLDAIRHTLPVRGYHITPYLVILSPA